ncbi:hypothetical protein L345_13144, partial [Ophiophagus hannah]
MFDLKGAVWAWPGYKWPARCHWCWGHLWWPKHSASENRLPSCFQLQQLPATLCQQQRSSRGTIFAGRGPMGRSFTVSRVAPWASPKHPAGQICSPDLEFDTPDYFLTPSTHTQPEATFLGLDLALSCIEHKKRFFHPSPLYGRGEPGRARAGQFNPNYQEKAAASKPRPDFSDQRGGGGGGDLSLLEERHPPHLRCPSLEKPPRQEHHHKKKCMRLVSVYCSPAGTESAEGEREEKSLGGDQGQVRCTRGGGEKDADDFLIDQIGIFALDPDFKGIPEPTFSELPASSHPLSFPEQTFPRFHAIMVCSTFKNRMSLYSPHCRRCHDSLQHPESWELRGDEPSQHCLLFWTGAQLADKGGGGEGGREEGGGREREREREGGRETRGRELIIQIHNKKWRIAEEHFWPSPSTNSSGLTFFWK